MDDVDRTFEAAAAQYAAGRLAEAEAALRVVVSRRPQHVEALHLLGAISLTRGGPHGAVVLVRRAVTIRPTYAAAWNTLGECYRAIDRRPAAAAAYRTALSHEPGMAAAHSNLAIVLADDGQAEAAVAAARLAVAIDPGLMQAWSILSTALLATGDAAGAVAVLDEAISRDPTYAPAHNNRGAALEQLDQLEEALAAYVTAAELDPTSAVMANNVTNVARQLNRYDDALAWTHRALAADAHFAPSRWALGLLQLTAGDYANGLANYQWRFAGTAQRHPPDLAGRPAWDGVADLSRGTLLVYSEQGFGDGFQAARYVPVVAERVGKLVILCHREQHRLFANLPGPAAVIPSGGGLPPFDAFAAMMSLPYLCGTRSLADVPKAVPYLSSPPEAVDRWRSRLPPSDRLKVGLVWAGSKRPDPLRTIPWPLWRPVTAVPGVDFYGLQVGPAAADAAGITDLSPELADFAETAAAMGQLDLVITIDTATAHLAGALGRPTWTLLPFSPDWRWLLDRADSPWYPTMRLFRQPERKAWPPVMAQVAVELAKLARRRAATA